jgi:hypothetical protein
VNLNFVKKKINFFLFVTGLGMYQDIDRPDSKSTFQAIMGLIIRAPSIPVYWAQYKMHPDAHLPDIYIYI